jgi:hypothetical protein
MLVKENRDKRTGADDGLLDSIERAITERRQTGYADEARYGFVARLANATPPVSATFEQALRARVLAELAKDTQEERRQMTVSDRWATIRFRRLSLVGALAAAVILALAIALSPRLRVWQPEGPLERPPERPVEEVVLQLDPGDVSALAEQLNQEPTLGTVLVFPGEYADALAEQIRREVVPLTLNGAVAIPAIHAALGAALPSSGLVDMIMVSQEATDLERSLRIVLEEQLYRLYHPGGAGVETFGALERVQYVVGPEDVALEPIGAVFENGVELVAAGILDDPQPGEPLRLALDWRVMEPVDGPVVVFAHLVYGGGQLVAQRDAVPGNGLFPVEEWGPGELVRDQFALLLPPELPAGAYEVQVGIYDPTSGQRFLVTRPEAGPCIAVKRWALED